MYGKAGEAYQKVAGIASTLLDKELTGEDVMRILIVVKLVRDITSPQEVDHLLDVCGYAALLSETRQEAEDEVMRTKIEHRMVDL